MTGKIARLAARTFFRQILFEGMEHLPNQGPVIFTPNHPNGLLDPMLLFFLSPPFRLRFVAKEPLFRVPLFGSILRSIGAIPVVRKFEAAENVDYSAFFHSCVKALEKGDCIVIFPEGRSLPQAYLAPLKTGPVRVSLLAQKQGLPVPIVPVGLNYERGTTFRSRVLIRIGAPLIPQWIPGENESSVVRQWTEDLSGRLEENVIQSETYRERELMLLLERLSAEQNDSEFMRFARLKQFERGLSTLQVSAASEIDTLRKLLSRYERLSLEYGLDERLKTGTPSWKKVLGFFAGAFLAVPGWLFNVIPYLLCDWLVRVTKRDAADMATFKVIYSLLLFPLFYVLEAYAVHRAVGGAAAVIFSVIVLPVSYFTMFYIEWQESHIRSLFWSSSRRRMKTQLERLRGRILERLEKLAGSL